MGIAVSCGGGTRGGAVGTTAVELAKAGADGIMGSVVVVVAAAAGTMVADEVPEPDMADIRLLELVLLQRWYVCEVAGRGLNDRR